MAVARTLFRRGVCIRILMICPTEFFQIEEFGWKKTRKLEIYEHAPPPRPITSDGLFSNRCTNCLLSEVYGSAVAVRGDGQLQKRSLRFIRRIRISTRRKMNRLMTVHMLILSSQTWKLRIQRLSSERNVPRDGSLQRSRMTIVKGGGKQTPLYPWTTISSAILYSKVVAEH